MTKPISIPTTFATSAGGPTPVSLLDSNFTTVYNAVNDLGTYTNYVTDSGSANTYILNYPAGITVALVNGLTVTFRALSTNTGGSTVNVNSLGAITLLRPDGTAVQAGDIPGGRIVAAIYDLSANAFYLNTLGAIPTGSAGSVTYQSPLTGSVSRTVQTKLQEWISAKDFGAVGNGISNDTAAMNTGITNSPYNFYSDGTYSVTGSFTLPFNKEIILAPNAIISVSGGGSATYNGPQVQFGYNPGAQTGFTSGATQNYDGFSVDFAGYGNRAINGTIGVVNGISGAVNVPASATQIQSNAIAAFAKSASTTCAPVAFYGVATSLATNVKAWGINTVTFDNGFSSSVLGYEADINVTNAGSTVNGILLTGATTVTPATSTGIFIDAIGKFANPTIKWGTAIVIGNAAATVGITLGSRLATLSQSQNINFTYTNSTPAYAAGMNMYSDNAGNFVMDNSASGKPLNLNTGAGHTLGYTGNATTGASSAALGSTKPGPTAPTAASTWVSIFVDGAQYWIPAFVN